MSMSGTDRAAEPGTLIAGRFRIEGELGGGGMAQVFRATDLAGGKAVALKLLKPAIAYDEEAIARLRREGEILSKLDTPAIVGIETFGRLDDGRIFIAMELLEGETLGEKMRRERLLDPKTLTPIVTGLVAGLSAAHRAEVVHRDLKPDNVFLTRSSTRPSVPTRMGDTEAVELGFGEDLQVKLVDFGISKAFDFARLTRTGQILGTPRYMAPEQLAADDDIDARVDVYALGVILYEALSGHPPFVAGSPSELIVSILHGKVVPLQSHRPDLSADIIAVVTRAMQRSRDARFSSAHDLAEAWLAVTHSPRAPGPREGMRTNVLGGLAVPNAETSDSGVGLKAGTFSAMQQVGAGAAKTTPSKKITTPRVEPLNDTSPARPMARASMPQAAPRPVQAPPQPVPSAPAHAPYPDTSGPLPTLPANNRRTFLIGGALLAGALSAAIVILALKMANRQGHEEEQAPQAPTSEPAAVPETTETVEEPSPSPTAPELETPPEAAPTEDDPEPARPRTEGSARRTMVTPMREEPANPPDDEPVMSGSIFDPVDSPVRPSTPAEILAAARDRLREGDPSACLRTLSALGRRLSASARRLEGDCYLRAGNRSEALKAYEQFCTDFPRNSNIDEVRALVNSQGGVCP